jgi:hypothetical protein
MAEIDPDIEQRLHDELDSVAAGVAPSPWLDGAVRARMAARARRRTAGLAAAAAVALVALVGGISSVTGDEPTEVETVTGPDGGAEARWEATAPAPIAARSGHVTAWTGEELLVWGGNGGGLDFLDDGAGYDPDTDTWRLLPPAPIGARTGAVSVWTGDEWLIFGGAMSGRTAFDAAAYDPVADSWRSVAVGLHPAAAVWTGDEVVLVGVDGGAGADLVSNIVALDPDDLSIRPLPAVPGSTFAAVVDGDEVLVSATSDDCDTFCTWRLDPVEESIELLDESGPGGPLLLQNGVLLGSPALSSLVVNPVDAGPWTVGATWEQSSALGESAVRWWQRRAADGAEVELPSPPEERPRYDAQAVWTGTEVLVWGGSHCSPDTDCAFSGPVTGLRLTVADPDGTPDTVPPDATSTTEPTGTTTELPSATDAAEPDTPADVVLLGAGTSFGMCAGICVVEMTFDEAGEVILTGRGHVGLDIDLPPIESRGRLTRDGVDQLASALADVTVGEPEVVVGCPDCADGGAAWVVLVDGEVQSRVTYQFGGPPPELAALDALTMAVRGAFLDCASNEVVDIDPERCTPARP